MTPTVFHIDVNSAFLSWTSVENLKNGTGPDLRDIPAIIGGDRESRHGIVLAKSISAKKYGIYTSEPVVSALKKCPNLVIFPPDHKMYHQYSRMLMDYLHELTPDIEQVSIDECYLDFTGIAHRYESPLQAAREIKDTVFEKFGFTVNVGISVNKLLAKMASDFEKPNKVHTLWPEEIPRKLWPLPVEELPMAGRASSQTLKKLGIRTIGDLANMDVNLLISHLKSHGRLLWEFANGIDDRPIESVPAKAKGIGNSTTLSRDARTFEDARPILRTLSDSVGGRLRKAGQLAGSISVEIKYSSFISTSHQMPLKPPANSNDAIYQAALELFSQLWNGEPIRLLGVRTTHLCDVGEPVQMNLFDMDWASLSSAKASLRQSGQTEKQKKLDAALDQIRQRYGAGSVKRGSDM